MTAEPVDIDAFWENPRAPWLARPPGCWCGPGDHDLFCPHWGKERVWVHPPTRDALEPNRLKTRKEKSNMGTSENKPSVNKEELATRTAERAGVPDKVAYAVINAFIEEVQLAVTAGERVGLTKFGMFEGRERAARVGRNPQTGEAVPVSARTAAVFKAAKAFQERVNAPAENAA